MASLNVLFEGVQVGSNNALVMCMVTQLLGDWKWHADLFLHIVFIRKCFFFVCINSYMLGFLSPRNGCSCKPITNRKPFAMLALCRRPTTYKFQIALDVCLGETCKIF